MIESLTALICGQVRNPDLLLRGVRNMWELRSTSFRVDRVIFSTWKGELSRYERLAADLWSSGVDVIEVDDPFQLPTGRGNIDRQMISLHHGLKLCSSETHVFRTRADQGINAHPKLSLIFEDYLDDVRENRAGFVAWVGSCSSETPFFIQDRFFLAPKKSMDAIANFRNNIMLLSDPGLDIPEIRWFAGSLVALYPQIIPMLSFDWLAIERYRPALFHEISTHPFTRAVFSNYFKIVDRHFLVGSDRIGAHDMEDIGLPARLSELPARKDRFIDERQKMMGYCQLSDNDVDAGAPLMEIDPEMLQSFNKSVLMFASYLRAGVPRVTLGSRNFPGNIAGPELGDVPESDWSVTILHYPELRAGARNHFEVKILDNRRYRGPSDELNVEVAYEWNRVGSLSARGQFGARLINGRYIDYPLIDTPAEPGRYDLRFSVKDALGADLVRNSFIVDVTG